MNPSLYLINPAERAPGYFGAEVLTAMGIARVTSLADLSTPTVAAMAPRDWHVAICDERVEPVNFDTPASIVGLTGKVSQRERMIELAAAFRQRGKLVLIGGPYASLNPDDMRPHADVLVRGEMEEIAAELFADLAGKRQKAEYVGTKPDLSASPIPRWDLYPSGRAMAAQVQTSRGCPFECEFCDVIQYLGRKQRWKEPPQVTRELDVLHRLGYRAVFFADDNLTVMRRRTKALLEHLVAWNAARQPERMSFTTQVSIDIARDEEMLRLLRLAGFDNLFIGIETPNEASLAETHKRQNLKIDLQAQVGRIVEAGLLTICGLVVGFDNDGPDIFERQAAFVQGLPAPLVMMGLLVAPVATPLYARIEAEGRLVSRASLGAGGLTQTNIRPVGMDEATLGAGMKWLFNQLYAPAAVAARIDAFVERCGSRGPAPATNLFQGWNGQLARHLAQQGPDEIALLRTMERAAARRPDLVGPLGTTLFYYCQSRHMLAHHGLWEPGLARRGTPRAA